MALTDIIAIQPVDPGKNTTIGSKSRGIATGIQIPRSEPGANAIPRLPHLAHRIHRTDQREVLV
jgi:hypothetical protein